MAFLRVVLLSTAAVACAQQLLVDSIVSSTSFPTAFSSGFRQPKPPLVMPEFKANWNQHKWNENVSHIASGYIYNSPSQNKVRVDLAYDTVIGSSLFDYGNVTDQGVANIQWLLTPAIASAPEYFVGFVQPAFPLVPANILVAGNAVYAGVRTDPYVGDVVAWNIMYASQLPTTLLLDSDRVIRGYDYWDTNERTYAITRFFNIITGKLTADLFDFPPPSSATSA